MVHQPGFVVFIGNSNRQVSLSKRNFVSRKTFLCMPRKPCMSIFSAQQIQRTGIETIKGSLLVAGGRVMRDPSGLMVLDAPGFSRPRVPWWPIGWLIFILSLLFRALWVRRRLRKPFERLDLPGDIASFYDARSAAWESVWGEHMHHGLYDTVNNARLNGVSAQIRTIDELLRFANVQNLENTKVLDIGCGIGGASRYLAGVGGETCQVTGITLSSVQAQRATDLNQEAGFDSRVKNIVTDILRNDFQDNSFDILWSLESAEHIPDKQLFISECKRLLKPGGRIAMLAWCVRESSPPFKTSEKFSIRRIMEEYCLPRISPPSEYVTELIRAGMRDVRYEDWTSRAAPFWTEVVASAAFSRKGWKAFARYGWPLLRSALAMRFVIAGIRQGVFRLVAFSAYLPTEEEAARETANSIKC